MDEPCHELRMYGCTWIYNGSSADFTSNTHVENPQKTSRCFSKVLGCASPGGTPKCSICSICRRKAVSTENSYLSRNQAIFAKLSVDCLM